MSDDIVNRIVKKPREVLIKFKAMQDILDTEGAWFDHHGNLRVHDYYGNRADSLAPSYFHYLGKTTKQPSHHSYPRWAIEREWDDMFAPNMALRAIASGKLSPEDMLLVAKDAVIRSEEDLDKLLKKTNE